ncbi:hypothetical protein BS329_38695 [Amycolatopsis coloradensis]|uniref:RNA polymerase sigma-70 region 2 domain-containing protein n=1 Tax=Amycolatopsis coloradensis TaxID=76021 RepID=A0A1R0KEP9_9PSEU|nr:sigma-70 family RNA polymerase sigma factor [Amycolatopsis coloradensis]OLZ43588.1 hypothetical protein BS329_38695 [Amycolatopsis coloradensis]
MTATRLDDPGCIITVSGRSDSELLAAVRAGDSDAYAVLFRRYHGRALQYARKHTRFSEIAEDAVMDAFLGTFQILLHQKGPTTEFRKYLFTAVWHAVVRRWGEGRHLLLVPVSDEALHGAEPSAETIVHDRFAARDQRKRAEVVLSLLPRRWQQILELTVLTERPIADVAAIFGLNPEATRSLAARARRGFRAKFLDLPDVA